MMTLAEQLRDIIVGEVADDNETLTRFSTDASLFSVRPSVVVFPKNTDDLKALVRFVREAQPQGQGQGQGQDKGIEKKLSLTGRAAGTDMSGGPLTESIVVAFEKYFTRLGNVREATIETEPGVLYRDFEKATLAKNLLMPAYPASRELCAIGGIVSNNSGGEKSLRYGKTVDYVEALDMVWSDGELHHIESVSKQELEALKRKKGLEGEVYKRIHALVQENAAVLRAAKPKVSKNSAGYALWDVYDEATGRFNLNRLLVGSQGTLGLVSNVRFKLVEPKNERQMLVISMRSLKALPQVIQCVLRHNPETFESYDNHTFRVALKYLPEILQSALRHHFIRLGFHLIPTAWSIMTGGIPMLVLLAEFTASTQEEAEAAAQAAAEELKDLPVRLRLTTSREEADAFLSIRRESFNLLRKHVHGMRTAPFIDDMVVRPEELPEFLPALYQILDRSQMIYTVAGHVGDGNFHIIPLVKAGDKSVITMIPKIADEVYALTIKHRGSITGEHNDGLIRTPYLEQQFGPEVCKLFAEVKHIFDPENIFNPGKKVGGSLDYALKHIAI